MTRGRKYTLTRAQFPTSTADTHMAVAATLATSHSRRPTLRVPLSHAIGPTAAASVNVAKSVITT